SAFLIIETSSTTIVSKFSIFTVDKPLSNAKIKLANVFPPIIVVVFPAFPVKAVLTILRRRAQLLHNPSTASITLLSPVPPSPPRNIRSCAS
ncbi:hypothetical protein PHMEG_00020943, partial [Phytophthora megakarya]